MMVERFDNQLKIVWESANIKKPESRCVTICHSSLLIHDVQGAIFSYVDGMNDRLITKRAATGTVLAKVVLNRGERKFTYTHLTMTIMKDKSLDQLRNNDTRAALMEVFNWSETEYEIFLSHTNKLCPN